MVVAKYSFSVQLCFNPQASVFRCFFAVYSRSFQSEFVIQNKIQLWKWKRRILGGRCHRLPDKTRNSAEPRGTDEEQEAELGFRTSDATRDAIHRREYGESLSSRRYQGSPQAKVSRGHQKSCRVPLHEDYQDFFRNSAFGDEDVSRLDIYENSRGSGRKFQQGHYPPLDTWNQVNVEAKRSSTHPTGKSRRIPLHQYSRQG